MPSLEILTNLTAESDADVGAVIDFVFDILGDGGESRVRTGIANPPMLSDEAAKLALQGHSNKYQLTSANCSVRVEVSTTFFPAAPDAPRREVMNMDVRGGRRGGHAVVVYTQANRITIDVRASTDECERIFSAFRHAFEKG